MYQYMTCPFCSKTRAFLLAHDIPFESVEVHPIFKKEIKFSKYKKVPIVTIQQGEATQVCLLYKSLSLCHVVGSTLFG